DVVHDPLRGAGARGAAAAGIEAPWRSEAHRERMASRDVCAATDERSVRAANARRNHRRARLQREQTDARQSGFEPSTHAERPFGKDADGVAVRERAERATERADV